MQIDAEHVAAVTIPLAIPVAIFFIVSGLVKGCEYSNAAELQRVKNGWVERYNPYAQRWEWYAITNAPSFQVEKQ